MGHRTTEHNGSVEDEEWNTEHEGPNCPVPGCKNKACLRLRADKCFPHALEDVANGISHPGLPEADWAAECLRQWRALDVVLKTAGAGNG